MTDLYSFKKRGTITSWDDALPLGNGKLGELIYGDGPIWLTLDRVDLWDNRPAPSTLSADFNYESLVKYSTGDDAAWEKKKQIFETGNDTPYPSKLTAGRIAVDFGKKSDDIEYSLDIKNAVAAVTLPFGKIESFMSATRFIGVCRIYGEAEISFRLPDYISRDGKGGLGYDNAETVRDGDFIYYVQHTKTDYSYGIVCLDVRRDGCRDLYYSIASSDDNADFIETEKRKLKELSALGYDVLLTEHKRWWHREWGRSSAKLGDEKLDALYIKSQYLLFSCSRRGFFPAPLQGVWTADNDELPPWKGDYHFDTNVQMTYASYLRGNHLDCGAPIIDYLWSMRSAYKKFAHDFFGVDGIIIPGCTTIDGKPLGGAWSQFSLSATMTIWMMQVFADQYKYTGDKKFLKDRAYPMLCDTGTAIAGLLIEKDGKLYLPLSSSPEMHDNSRAAYMTPNTAFDTALLRYLYSTLTEFCRILGYDGSKWQEIFDKLDGLPISESGFIKLSRDEGLEVSHRHFSHLMSLYPLRTISYYGNETLYEKNLHHLMMYGTELWVGFSFVWASALQSCAKNGTEAYNMLKIFADGFVNDNGFHLNGDFRRRGYSRFHYRPFTLEANFGYCDSVHNMMLQNDGTIEIFPAMPIDLPNAEFKTLRSEGGILVSAKRKNCVTVALSAIAPNPATVVFTVNGKRKTVKLKKGNNVII